jgi:hypothetical protein
MEQATSKVLVVYFSTLKMEAICCSETSVDFHRTIRCYNPEDRILHNSIKRALNGSACQTGIAEQIEHISCKSCGFRGTKLRGLITPIYVHNAHIPNLFIYRKTILYKALNILWDNGVL